MLKVMPHEHVLEETDGVYKVCSGACHWHIWHDADGAQVQRLVGRCDCPLTEATVDVVETTMEIVEDAVPAWWSDPMP